MYTSSPFSMIFGSRYGLIGLFPAFAPGEGLTSAGWVPMKFAYEVGRRFDRRGAGVGATWREAGLAGAGMIPLLSRIKNRKRPARYSSYPLLGVPVPAICYPLFGT